MKLDKYGLPVNIDPNGQEDANDQLQRVGMIDTAVRINEGVLTGMPSDVVLHCAAAISTVLEPLPGLYTRSVGSPTWDVSADQLISVLCSHIAGGFDGSALMMFLQMTFRLGFAQNIHDINGSTKLQMPDLMAPRALPLFARMNVILYPLTMLADLYLIVMAISAVIYARGSTDNVYQNDTIMTLAVCAYRMPTPISWLARKIFVKLLPANLGSGNGVTPVYGSLLWYHRPQAGGNIEIAQMYKPICDKYFV